MDPMQIASLASSLDSYQLDSQVSTLVLKKALDAQKSMASDIIQQIPQLPSNPAINSGVKRGVPINASCAQTRGRICLRARGAPVLSVSQMPKFLVIK